MPGDEASDVCVLEFRLGLATAAADESGVICPQGVASLVSDMMLEGCNLEAPYTLLLWN